jgi:hypothetical protein
MTSATATLRGPLRKRESHLWAREEHDWYVEPEWCSARLFQMERFDGPVWDASCGGGNILRSARAAGLEAVGSDIVQRGAADFIGDFLTLGAEWPGDILGNPPFDLCDDRKTKTHPWPQHALRIARGKVALLLPANWVQGDQRSRWLQHSGLARVLFIAPRPSMPPGQVIAAGGKPGNGTTDYAWFIWRPGHNGPAEIGWLRRDDLAGEDVFG